MHLVLLRGTALASLLATSILAAPSEIIPRQDEEINVVKVIGFEGTEQKCGVTYDDRLNAWRNSGAAAFLDGWIAEHGSDNWARRMDQMTTDGGSTGTSALNCIDFDVPNCPYPQVLCRQFTPPELWHVRKAMATAHGMITAVFNGFQRSVIREKLNANNIISDFGPAAAGFDIFGGLAGAFTVAAGGGAAAAIASGPLTILAGIFGLLGGVPEQTVDLNAELDNQLLTAFESAEVQTRRFLRLVFGGEGDTSMLPGALEPGSNREETDIAKFFSSGKFLYDVDTQSSIDTDLRPILENGHLHLRQRLVNSLLRAQGYFVFVDTSIKDGNGCKGNSARWIGDECYRLFSFTTEAGYPVHRQIENEKVDKFEDPDAGYDINLEQFYNACNECSRDRGYGGDLESGEFNPQQGGAPLCFFNLPVIRSAYNACTVENIGDLPAEVGITTKRCSRPAYCQQRPNACL